MEVVAVGFSINRSTVNRGFWRPRKNWGSAPQCLRRLSKNWRCRSRRPSAAKASFDFAILTARLKAAPFQNKIKTRFFRSIYSQHLKVRLPRQHLRDAQRHRLKRILRMIPHYLILRAGMWHLGKCHGVAPGFRGLRYLLWDAKANTLHRDYRMSDGACVRTIRSSLPGAVRGIWS